MSVRLILRRLLWLALVALLGCGPKSIVGETSREQSSLTSVSPAQQPGPSASINQPSPEKPKQNPPAGQSSVENSVRPSVIWVTVFDSSGKLLRTQTGFFISRDGRLVTTAHAIENGINAVAKTADGEIYNVSGILAVSTTLDLAILQADVKPASFLPLNPNTNLPVGARVVIVGSGLAGSEGTLREVAISAQESNRLEISAPISASSIGSPVLDSNGEAIGIVVSAGDNGVARPSSSIEELVSQIASNATPKWPTTAETRATPTPIAKARLVYAPAPAFPPQASQPGISGSGRFRITFDARGNATNVQVIQSTRNALFDQSAVTALRQWRAAPGRESMVTVPVTFQTR